MNSEQMNVDRDRRTETTAPYPQSAGNSPSGGKAGPAIGIVIVVAVLVLGAIYYFSSAKDEPENVETNWEDTDATLENLENQNSSDELNAIEIDVSDTNIDSIDAGIDL